MRSNIKYLRLKGIKLGILSEVTGCAVFVALEQTRQILYFGFDGQTNILVALLIFIFGSILAILPTIIGVILLSEILYRKALYKKVSLLQGIGWGCLIGTITGVVVSMLGFVITTGKGSPVVYFSYSIEVSIIAFLSGGWLGYKLAKNILHFQQSGSLGKDQ